MTYRHTPEPALAKYVQGIEAERDRLRDVVVRAFQRLGQNYDEYGPTGDPGDIDEAIGDTLLILGEEVHRTALVPPSDPKQGHG